MNIVYRVIPVFLSLFFLFSCTGIQGRGNNFAEAGSLTRGGIKEEVYKYAKKGYFPVHYSGNSVLYLEYDLNNDKRNDYFVLFVESNNNAGALFANLSNYTRHYDGSKNALNFFVQVFICKKNKLIPTLKIPIGRKKVLESFKLVKLNRKKDKPFAVSARFSTMDGTENECVIFYSNKKYSTFRLEETLVSRSFFMDIDSDGMDDVISYEDRFEEGSGTETFLTWYKWNGTGYIEYKNTNILRNLHSFFSSLRDFLRRDQRKNFVGRALPAGAVSSFKKAGLGELEIMDRLFKPVSAGNPSLKDLIRKNTISNMVFPRILENPFSSKTSGYTLQITVKIILETGEEQLFNARLCMDKNPFSKSQFFFLSGS